MEEICSIRYVAINPEDWKLENNFKFVHTFSKEYQDVEQNLYFYPAYYPLGITPLLDYLEKVKKDEILFISPLYFETEDGKMVKYFFETCDTKEKYEGIRGANLEVFVPEDCPYRKIFDFPARVFSDGIKGFLQLKPI